MRDVFIYDHVRTPRGRGRPDGSLHEIPSVELVTQLLQAVQTRNNLDTALLEEVVMGSAQPVGEQGGVLARAAALNAGYAESVSGLQVNRFCGSGLDAVNTIAAQIGCGMMEAGIGGGVESMSRTIFGYDSGAWTSDPHVALHNYYTPWCSTTTNCAAPAPPSNRSPPSSPPLPAWRASALAASCASAIRRWKS